MSFALNHGVWHAEALALDHLARRFGTPLLVYSQAALQQALGNWQSALRGTGPSGRLRQTRIHYAMKANSNLALVQWFVQQGCGLDIVSGGELERALLAGCPPERIIFSGVGKSRAEMRRALQVGIGCFNVESQAELAALNAVALTLGLRAPISLRINPDIDACTHPYIATGLHGNKFGIAHTEALASYLAVAALPGLRIVGIDCHIGSQITTVEPYQAALERLLDLVVALQAQGVVLAHINVGGGLGICYDQEAPPSAPQLWQTLWPILDARGFGDRCIYAEPGRSLVGNAAVCVGEVLYVKEGRMKNFCIVDMAMNDMPRPAMYEAYHRIEPVRASAGRTPLVCDVVGPVCESGDWLGRDRLLAVQAGDIVAMFGAGAYCMSMASHYNTRMRAAEVLVAGDQVSILRQRETLQQVLLPELHGTRFQSSQSAPPPAGLGNGQQQQANA